MVTIKTIAEKSGLSIAAVSKALNGRPGISPERAEQVRQLARELGYYPNEAARTLKTNRSYNIGILFQNRLAHEYFSQILESIRQTAEERGYDITFLRNRNISGAGYYECAKRRQCDGVIVTQGEYEPELMDRLVNSDIPLVSIEQGYPGHTAIMSDNVGSMEEIVRYLHSLGHDRLALIHGELGDVTRQRLAGFYRGCRDCGIQVPEEFVIPARYHEPKDSGQAVKRLMAGTVKPTCILFPDDVSSLGGMTALGELGLSIPGDVSCFGYDGIRMASVLRPSLATYHQNAQSIGRRAAEELISSIEDPRCYVPQNVVVPGDIQPGGTVRDLRGLE